MKITPINLLLCCVGIVRLAQPSSATEAETVKYKDKLPSKYDSKQVVIFENGPKGQQSSAYRKAMKRQQAKEAYLQKTPAFKSGELRLIAQTPIPTLPGHSLWTYKVSGLTPQASKRTVRLSLEKTPSKLKLAIPSSCQTKGNVIAERFDPELLKNIPEADSICNKVHESKGVTYFEKPVAENAETVNISIVATSVPATPLIGVEASINGYQPIKAMTPGPDVE